MALILIALLENASIGPHWLLPTLATLLIVGRLWHAQGLLSSSGTSAGRFAGTNMTLIVIVVGSVACLGRGVGAW